MPGTGCRRPLRVELQRDVGPRRGRTTPAEMHKIGRMSRALSPYRWRSSHTNRSAELPGHATVDSVGDVPAGSNICRVQGWSWSHESVRSSRALGRLSGSHRSILSAKLRNAVLLSPTRDVKESSSDVWRISTEFFHRPSTLVSI